MKLSKREKRLMLALLISIMMFLYNKYIPTIITNESSINEQYNKTKEVYINMSQNIKDINLYYNERQKLLSEVNGLNILSEIKQEDIIEILYKNLSSSGIEITSINFTEPLSTVIGITSNEIVSVTEIDNDKNDENENSKLSISSMIVNVEFKSNYENILNLIDKLQENKNDIAITNIHIIKSDFIKVHGILDISFYAIPLNFKIMKRVGVFEICF